MNHSIRVAVIEIGSRAVRLLVADVSRNTGLQVVGTDWKETGSAQGSAAKDLEIQTWMNQVIDTVRRFSHKAREFDPAWIAAIGTETVRRFGNDGISRLREICPDFRVLSSKEEAELSLVTAAMGVEGDNASGDELLVVDQGSGSMEVVVGIMGPNGARVRDSRSYKLGTRELVKLLTEVGNLPTLRKELTKRFSKYKPLKKTSAVRPIILGSAATKLAWIKIRPDDAARYDPRQIHGCLVTLEDIDLLMRIAEGDSKMGRQLIDPRNPQSSEFETVVCGLAALEVFLKRENRKDFIVCAHGTRYGFAWKLALEVELTATRA